MVNVKNGFSIFFTKVSRHQKQQFVRGTEPKNIYLVLSECSDENKITEGDFKSL
jgi:hypothetical protein